MLTIADKRDKALMYFDDEYFDQKFAEYEADIFAGKAAPPDIDGNGHCNRQDYGSLDVYYADIIQMKGADESELDADVWNYLDNDFDLDGNGISGDVYDIYLAMAIIIKYEDEDGKLDTLLKAYNSKMEAEAAEIVSKQEISYLSSLDVKRSGDANNDGQVNMADAVMIMQTVTNPDKYQLSDWGEFNADIADTGDGVTANDACLLQKNLLNK